MKLKNYYSVLLFLCLVAISFAQDSPSVVYVYWDDPGNVNYLTEINADLEVVGFIEAAGIEVTAISMPLISEATSEQIDLLNDASVVIVGRAIPSGNFAADEERLAWNDIAAPIISTNMWGLRSHRGNWFDSETATANIDNTMDQIFDADILEPSDPVFEGIESSTIGWWKGHYSEVQLTEAGNGTVMAATADNGYVLYVRFEAFTPFYDDGETPYGERIYIGNGSDNLRDGDNKIFNYYGWTEESEQVFLNEIKRHIEVVSVENKKVNIRPLKVYANAKAGELLVSMGGLKSVNIYTLLGQKVKSTNARYDVVSIPVTSKDAGLFVVEAFDKEGNRYVQKVLIK